MISGEVQPRYITPTLPPNARLDITTWKAKGKYHNAFIRPLVQIEGVLCRNCVDDGYVRVSYCRAGPFASVPNHKVGETLTWFDGDEKTGKGWYIIVHTRSYNCSLCRPEGDRLASPQKQLELIEQEEFPWQSYVD